MQKRHLPFLAAWPALTLALSLGSSPAGAQKADKPVPPQQGPRATAVHDATLYVSRDEHSERLAKVSPGREMVVAERSGEWLRVFANTDVEAESQQDAPIFGEEAVATPISGWLRQNGVITPDTPNGDTILFGVAANFEEQASEANAPHGAAQSARLLYRRMAEIFPSSPRAAEAMWRAADIRWQLEKADVFSRPSGHEKQAYLRSQIDDDEMKKIEKKYPHTRFADLAAYDLLDNKICGDWQGSTKCPEKEAEMFSKYAEEHPDSPRAAEAVYKAVWREASLGDMYAADNDDKKAEQARARAKELSANLTAKYPQSDYAARAASLVYKVEQGIPIYGADRE
jgi:outer membrane protein assembly factor BamD (BamD/ComL family)